MFFIVCFSYQSINHDPSLTGIGIQAEESLPLFMNPQTLRLAHSTAYLKYIEGLKADKLHVSNWETQLKDNPENTLPDRTVLPVSWLQNGAASHGNVVIQVIYGAGLFYYRVLLTSNEKK